jgi:pimeloyl-ACP methyl ester carboxylesterase
MIAPSAPALANFNSPETWALSATYSSRVTDSRLVALLTLTVAASGCVPADWGAGAILTPYRKAVTAQPDLAFENVSFANGDVILKGWLFRTTTVRRGLLVYLHGIGDNREGGIGLAHRFLPQGYDVLAYDSRAHGESSGTSVTYGVNEKVDLMRALDAVHADRAVLFGCSLGASVALQAAALEPRVVGVIAQSPFADLRSIVQERKPWVFSVAKADEAIGIAEHRARFHASDASVVVAAPHIRVPVLLIHGARDRETSPQHSRRIFDGLGGPKELLIVPGAGHNDVLAGGETWRTIEAWLARLPF